MFLTSERTSQTHLTSHDFTIPSWVIILITTVKTIVASWYVEEPRKKNTQFLPLSQNIVGKPSRESTVARFVSISFNDTPLGNFKIRITAELSGKITKKEEDDKTIASYVFKYRVKSWRKKDAKKIII